MNEINIMKLAKDLKLSDYIGKKVVAKNKHNHRPNEVAEIVGWGFDIFELHPTEKFENYFYLYERFSDGEIFPIPHDPISLKFEFVE